MKSLTYTLAAAVALLALPLHPAFSAEPPDTSVATVSGRTTIELDLDLLEALDELDIKVRALAASSWCTAKNGSVTLPIIGGVYDPGSSTGEIIHRGGVVLKSDDVKVVLSNLILEVTEGSEPVISGLVVVDGALQGRHPLFKVDFGATDVTLKPTLLKISDADLTLTSEAAEALNTAFSLTEFAEDDTVGEADIIAVLRKLNFSAAWLDPSKHHKHKHKKNKGKGHQKHDHDHDHDDHDDD